MYVVYIARDERKDKNIKCTVNVFSQTTKTKETAATTNYCERVRVPRFKSEDHWLRTE